MSMTTVAAKVYVARIIGGGAESQEPLDMAGEALLRAYQDWQGKKFWRFLLKDTSAVTTVSGLTATFSSSSVSPVVTGSFDFVNVGQTVTISTSTATLAAGTTVSSIDRGSNGVVTAIGLSNSFGGATGVSSTLTFSANIPIVSGTNDYALPTDFNAPFGALLLTNKRTLVYRDQRYWDRVIVDQTVPGTPAEYTMYNSYSDLSQNFGTTRLKFDRVPNASDTLFLRYYRCFTTTGTNIDMPDEFLYQFLDYARKILLITKTAQDNPQSFVTSADAGAETANESDEDNTDDDDDDRCMKSQYEMGVNNRPLWGNGSFDPYR